MIKHRFTGLIFGAAMTLAASAHAASQVNGTLTIVIQAAPVGLTGITFNPGNPTIVCALAKGTVVSTLTAVGGDGTAVTWTLGGDTADFSLTQTTATTAEIVVGSNGIAAADCGQNENVTVGASQQ